MKPKKKISRCAVLGAVALSVLCSSCGGNKGTFTIVNATLESAMVNFNGKDIVLESQKHFTQKGLKPSTYSVKVGKDSPLNVEIAKKKTTLVDLGGDNCFVIADYTNQYDEKGDGAIKVVEKFVNQKTFTTSRKLTADLGEQLPEVVHHNEKIFRLHRVDCSWIDNDQAIVDAIANLP